MPEYIKMVQNKISWFSPATQGKEKKHKNDEPHVKVIPND